MIRKRNGGTPTPPRSAAGGTPFAAKNAPISTTTWIIMLVFSSCMSFYVGVWTAWSIAPTSVPSSDSTERCLQAALGEDSGELGDKIGGIFKLRLERALDEKRVPETKKCPEIERCPTIECPETKHETPSDKPRFSGHLDHFVVGAVRVNRKKMFDAYDFGVPMSANAENEDTLILYDSVGALPSNKNLQIAAKTEGDIPKMEALDATENCDQMNVLFWKNPLNLRQCVALIGGQFQGYHIQRWMRIRGEGEHGALDRNVPLHQVSRMTSAKGYDELTMPKIKHLNQHRKIMLTYLTYLEEMQKELNSTLARIAVNNTVVVMTVNKGQSELLMNFVCSSRSRGFNVSNILIFPTDVFSKDLAEGLGLATFFNEELTKDIPSEEAERYGDRTFGNIMMAKVICVQLVNELGYDMLFQDVDVVWYKNPFDVFNAPGPTENYDVYFQDDGSRNERYTPYSANSGFYFVRGNDRTKLLFRTLLYQGDLIFACRSHQQVLISLLSEMNSYAGLKVKVLSRDEDDFPGGYHYHMRKDWMRKMVDGAKNPFVFHMSWTLNKVNKLEFMKQMGMWFVHDKCIGKDVKDILPESNVNKGLFPECCSAEPLNKCYYSDKPSVIPCKDSPVMDKGIKSFW